MATSSEQRSFAPLLERTSKVLLVGVSLIAEVCTYVKRLLLGEQNKLRREKYGIRVSSQRFCVSCQESETERILSMPGIADSAIFSRFHAFLRNGASLRDELTWRGLSADCLGKHW